MARCWASIPSLTGNTGVNIFANRFVLRRVSQRCSEFGCDVLLELGPRPVLTGMAAAAWTGNAPTLISTLDATRTIEPSLLAALAQLHVRGATVNFDASHDGTSSGTCSCQRILSSVGGLGAAQAASLCVRNAHIASTVGRHGNHSPTCGMKQRFENSLAADHPHWLEHHKVMDDVVFPGAAYVETALAAGKTNALSDVTFDLPLRISTRVCLQTIVKSGEDEQQDRRDPFSDESLSALVQERDARNSRGPRR